MLKLDKKFKLRFSAVRFGGKYAMRRHKRTHAHALAPL